MSHFITTHNAKGKAVFSDRLAPEQVNIPSPMGSMTILSTSHHAPCDPSTEKDIDHYDHDRTNGLPPGMICPSNGYASSILTFAPGATTPMHRTMTIDTVVCIEGVMLLQLDSGEERTMKAGDSMVQRATLVSVE